MEEVPVRVAVRVRPLVGQEKTHNVPKCITFVPDKPQLILGKDKAFTFDYVFQPAVTQCEVYQTCVEPLVASCFDGYNATVFVYGQTGSGKTYTIGSSNTAELLDDEYGVIPRALEEIFCIIQERKDKIHFVVSASYIEIYMEEVRDLLDLDTSTKDIHIREDEHGHTVITGATEQVVESADEALSCLDAGAAGRHVGSTNMNEHSSRSHAIFTLYIEQQTIQPEEKENEANANTAEFSQFMSAKFHFVDLAGSERAHRTGNVGERFKESVHINTGLLALGNVISALSDSKKKAGHIPYRDSKITRILKDSLGGNARTVMLTCLSPAVADLAENLNSLKYATRARYIKNKPVVNRDPQAAKLAEMQDEIEALREELQRTRAKTLESVSDIGDGGRIKEAMEELERTQQDLEIVRCLLEEATSLLNDVHKANGMNRTLAHQYDHLKKRVEKVKKGQKIPRASSVQKHQNEIIEELRKELEKYKNDLAADHDIFAERTKESNSLRDRIKELEQENIKLSEELKDVLDKLKKHDDQLLRQQVQLNKHLTPRENGFAEDHDDSKTNTGKKIPDDSPVDRTSAKRDSLTTNAGKSTLDRMMENFRARSDVLVGQYEDDDEVQHSISDTSDSDQEEKIEKHKNSLPAKTLEKTWNAKEKSVHSANKKVPKTRQISSTSTSTKNSQSNVKKRSEIAKEEKLKRPAEDEIQNLRMSTQVTQGQVHKSEVRLREAQRQLRDLAINIKLKQELIKELVRSDKEANVMKKTFSDKVEEMEKEVEKKKKDLEETQKTLTQYEVKSLQEQQEKQKLEQEYKRKLQTLEEQLHELQKRQKDNQKVSVLYNEREKKLTELENHLEKMKQQQDNLHKKLKDETEKKMKMEKEVQKDQQKIKELEEKNVQNEKILKRKTEEVAAAQRKLRRKTSKEENDEASKLDERRQWLDTELENILNKKQAMEVLQEELKKREAILKEREQMAKDKSQLEMKKMRSSQVLSKDILRMSTQLDTVEEQLREKDMELKENEDEKESENIRHDIDVLESKRSELMKQREKLDSKLKEGSLLNIEEERRLLEFDEGIEALEAAIEFKTDSINTHKRKLDAESPELSQNNLVTKLNSLGREDAIFLLSKYFEKVVSHRENERKQKVMSEDLALRVDEQDRVIRELERGFQQVDLRAERRLTDQAKEYEQRVQFLMKQVNDMEKETGEKDNRIHELEKDLYYYKKLSRDLKKRMRELVGKDGVLDSMQTASVQGEGPSEVERKLPVEGKNQEKRENKTNVKNGLEKVTGSQASTPVRLSRKDLKELSQKEVSIRRTLPSSRSDVTASGTPRKQPAEQMSLVQRSEKSSRRDRESIQANSLQDSIEQSGNPWT